jgi:dynein light intermediate chain
MLKKEEELKSLVKYSKPTVLTQNNSRLLEGQKNSKIENQTEDILNSILPPREYTIDKKQLYIENVLSTPATELDVIALKSELEFRLSKKEARENGLCPIREDLFSQCFDELIRQITISCSNQGLLLVRVRDELRINIECYQKLYESALSYGIRKSLLIENEKNSMNIEIKNLNQEILDLQNEVQRYEVEIDESKEKHRKNDLIDSKKHEEEISNIKKKNQRLKEELEKRLAA